MTRAGSTMAASNWSRSKRFFLAATVLGLLALKFRAALAAGIDLPAGSRDWLAPSGWNAWLTARNGQWDPFLLRLFNSVIEAVIAGIGISLIARCCRPSNGGGWATLLGGTLQLVLASFGPPALVESWHQPWFIALLCESVLILGLIRRLRIAVLATFIVVAGAAWWTGALRPAPREYPQPGEPRGAAVRQDLAAGRDPALADPAVRAQLPLAARAALPLGQTITSDFSYVAVSARRTGSLSAPASVSLRRTDGRLVPALQGELPADHAWHRLNLPVPHEPFVIITAGSVETGPAVEYSAGSRDAGKILRAWPVCAVLAFICVMGGVLCLSIPNERHGWKLAWTPTERRVLPWLALAAYAGVLVPFLDTYAGGSDSAGYLGSARLLQHFQIDTVVPIPADLSAAHLPATGFLPRGFALEAPSGAGPVPPMVPTYPVGLPLWFCLAQWVLPAALAIPAVILFHLLAGLIVIYLLARQLALSESWALAAAGFLALCPIYLFMGLQPMSDVPALVWVSAAVSLAFAARASGRDRLAIAAGICTAVAVLIRPANVIALPIVALALPLRPRAFLSWIAGGLPFAILEAVYNHRLYGHVFLTGYGSAGGLFSAGWVLPTVLHYLHWLPLLLTPAIIAVLALPFRRRVAAPVRWLLSAWAAIFLLFYATYSCTHETWWYLRFLLPAIPALIIGALLVLRDVLAGPVASSAPQRWVFGTAVTLCIATWLLIQDDSLRVLDSGQGNQVYADSSQWLEQNAPDNALVVCSYTSGALYYYSHRAFFQPATAADASQIRTAAAAAGRPLYAAFFRFDQQPLAWFTGGHWTEVHRSGDIVIWRWDASA